MSSARIALPRRPSRLALPCLLTALALLVSGCSGTDEQLRDEDPRTGDSSPPPAFADDGAPAGAARARRGNLETGSADIEFDLNQDGRSDQFHYRSGAGLERIDRDINFDGRTDAWEHYAGGTLVEEEIDLDLDGNVDVVRFYENGVVRSKRYAVGFRADLAISRSYDAQGRLLAVERDTDRDGRVDTWEQYQPGSATPVRVDVDNDRDGRPDGRPAGATAIPATIPDGGDDDDPGAAEDVGADAPATDSETDETAP